MYTSNANHDGATNVHVCDQPGWDDRVTGENELALQQSAIASDHASYSSPSDISIGTTARYTADLRQAGIWRR